MAKLKVATTSLGGCFGCHMAFLDIDERIVDLAEVIEFDRSPFTDIKHCSEIVDIGLIEGCLLYTSPSPRDGLLSRMPSSA